LILFHGYFKLTANNQPIGWYLPEAAHPYHVLHKDFEIVGASPKGNTAPVDHTSVEQFMDDQGKFFLEDPTAQKIWKETVKLSEIKASDFKALFIVGGVSLPFSPWERNGADS
jgi:putative intracellular protease/amidase